MTEHKKIFEYPEERGLREFDTENTSSKLDRIESKLNHMACEIADSRFEHFKMAEMLAAVLAKPSQPTLERRTACRQ